jgi:hypothetical protein
MVHRLESPNIDIEIQDCHQEKSRHLSESNPTPKYLSYRYSEESHRSKADGHYVKLNPFWENAIRLYDISYYKISTYIIDIVFQD